MQRFPAVFQGGPYFHPTDEDMFVGTRVLKDPLNFVASGYSNCENAVVVP